MNDISDHARVLHKLYYELSSTVDAQTVASHMFEQSALERKDLESIQSKRSEPTRAAEQLLDIIMEKSRSTYWCFLKALKQSNQEHVQKMTILESSESEFNCSTLIKPTYSYQQGSIWTPDPLQPNINF